MRKVSILSGVLVFTAWAIFVFYAISTKGIPKDSEILLIIGVSLLAFILPALLVYLGGLIIKGNKGAFRSGVLLSVIWIFIVLVVTEPYGRYGNITDFLLAGILPAIVFWGILWVLNGFVGNNVRNSERDSNQ